MQFVEQSRVANSDSHLLDDPDHAFAGKRLEFPSWFEPQASFDSPSDDCRSERMFAASLQAGTQPKKFFCVKAARRFHYFKLWFSLREGSRLVHNERIHSAQMLYRLSVFK